METILYYLVIFFSNVVQAITGFAGTLLAMPPAIQLVGVESAKMTLNFFGLAASIVIWFQNHKSSNKKEVIKMLLFMGVGMGLGFLVEKSIPMDYLLTFYAVFLILFGIYKLLSKKEQNINKWAGILILLASGMIHEWFVSGGALLVIYAAATFKNKDEFRASLAPVWVILNSILLMLHIGEGYATPDNLWKCLIGLVPLILAVFIGNKLHTKVNQKTFLKISYVLILLNGVLLIV